MIYYKVKKQEENLYFVEDHYDERFALKTETVFAQCNGYIGVRACFDQQVLSEDRGMFVSGFYHKAYDCEVTELVKCPDITEIRLWIDGELIGPESCDILSYERKLNLRSGELVIDITLESKKQKKYRLVTKRFASLSNRHLFCHELSVTSLSEDVDIKLETGINGQITNSGVSHFEQVESRVYDRQYMHLLAALNEKERLSIISVCDAGEQNVKRIDFGLKRRSIYGTYHYKLEQGKTLSFHKYSYIDTETDCTKEYADKVQRLLLNCKKEGYHNLCQDHQKEYDAYWKYAGIDIEGAGDEEKAAIAFAQYHLLGMTPYHTSKYSIGAKGLTGEGYKGHVFWDAELFILPYFIYTFPETARDLLIFRYKGLEGARKKAREYGYEGAMFPWEVAADGREQTPLYAALNIHTGKAAKVWSGIKEHHVTADIIYAVWEYYRVTGDGEFMQEYGYELTLEAAAFWVSRTKWNRDKQYFEINDIIGPDEYTEHVNNNAYSNYMARYCIMKGLEVLEETDGSVKEELKKWKEKKKEWQYAAQHLYIPKPNEDKIIPQDDTFLSKKLLPDIEKYRNSHKKQAVLMDYSREEVVDMQVLKQADVVMLLNLFPDSFPADVVKKNVLFYEDRTLHDSSLSVCAHAIACADIGEEDMAYRFFRQSMEIDINDNPNDSTDGIHAASLGGIWNCVIRGFAGVKIRDGYLEINPHLPKHWKSMHFYVNMNSAYLEITITGQDVQVCLEGSAIKPVRVKVDGRFIEVTGRHKYVREKQVVG